MWDSKLRGANIHDPLIGLGPLIAQTADSRGLFETKETLISLPSTSGVLSLNCSSRVGGPVEGGWLVWVKHAGHILVNA